MQVVKMTKVLYAKADMINMKCKINLQKRRLKLNYSVKRPIILTGSVKENDSSWVRECLEKDVNKNRDAGQKDNANKTDDSKDKITVSGKAKEINELKGLISDVPDIRTDRVDAIKKAIDSGNYNVDAQEVAGKILEEM